MVYVSLHPRRRCGCCMVDRLFGLQYFFGSVITFWIPATSNCACPPLLKSCDRERPQSTNQPLTTTRVAANHHPQHHKSSHLQLPFSLLPIFIYHYICLYCIQVVQVLASVVPLLFINKSGISESLVFILVLFIWRTFT